MITFPREVHAVHQIELTSRCNLRCVYCPSPDIMKGKYPDRPAVDMTLETFERALEWVRHYVGKGTQKELNLAGIGESTIHPQFTDFVRRARLAAGPAVKIVLATNGINHDEEMIREIAKYNPLISVSLHRPEKAGPAIELYKKYGIIEGISIDPSINGNDWAGQVQWFKSGSEISCQWMNEGKVMVAADGNILSCCLDASGSGKIGTVWDAIGSVRTKPYDLCRKCYQKIDGLDQGEQV